jgi:2-amino-4-hydroxy-6-hydroxymethyldihydropteridine diphosphokinase
MTAWVGIGANLGDASENVLDALDRMTWTPGVRLLRASSLYRTAPIDSSGYDYINAVAEVDTSLSARALLAALHDIEQAHGRERPYRNAPRTLDLDLLLFDDEVIGEAPTLIVPHPRMHERAFVLAPMAELAPGLVIPGRGRVADLLAGVAGQAIARID